MRPSYEEIFMNMAHELGRRSTCDRAFVGCVIVKDNIPVALGYNGSVRGRPHCSEAGHLIIEGSCHRTIHAEENAILNAARKGISIFDAVAYVTHHPCWGCWKKLANTGIKKVIYDKDYRGTKNFLPAQWEEINTFSMEVKRFHLAKGA